MATETPSDLLVYEGKRSVAETMDRIEKLLKEKHIPVYMRFDHSRNALEAGLELRPTEVILFGSPANGTLLMERNQQVGIELPLRILVWEDEMHKTHIGFTRMDRLAERYGLSGNPIVGKTQALLEQIASQVASA